MRAQLSDIEKARFLLLENCVIYCLDPEPDPKLFQSRNRNRNKLPRFHNIDLFMSLTVGYAGMLVLYYLCSLSEAREVLRLIH
jgi:hypothetical protein